MRPTQLDAAAVEEAMERLEAAASTDAAARVALLEELHAALEAELDSDEAPPAGR
jgi:hypothetical protein